MASVPGSVIPQQGIDPVTGEVKGRIRSGGPDRQPLRFVEVVVNNPKSLSIVASQDGTRYDDSTINSQYPFSFGANDASNLVTLVQINKLVKINNVRLVAVNTASNNPARPVVAGAYQIGDSPTSAPANSTGAFALHVGAASNPTTFTFPLGAASGTAQYTFSKIIEFNPQGEVSKIDENVFSGPGPQSEIEIALDPTHGSTITPAYSGSNQNMPAVAIQIEGLTGQVRVYRP